MNNVLLGVESFLKIHIFPDYDSSETYYLRISGDGCNPYTVDIEHEVCKDLIFLCVKIPCQAQKGEFCFKVIDNDNQSLYQGTIKIS